MIFSWYKCVQIKVKEKALRFEVVWFTDKGGFVFWAVYSSIFSHEWKAFIVQSGEKAIVNSSLFLG